MQHEHFTHIIEDHILQQMIKDKTRNESYLDLLLTNNQALIQQAKLQPESLIIMQL